MSTLAEIAAMDDQIAHMRKELKRLEEERECVVAGALSRGETSDDTYTLTKRIKEVRMMDAEKFASLYPDVYRLLAIPTVKIDMKKADELLGKINVAKACNVREDVSYVLIEKPVKKPVVVPTTGIPQVVQ